MVRKATSVRLDDDTLDRVSRLAKAMDRPRAWVMAHAIEEYVKREEWLIEQIHEGVRAADEGRLVDHAVVRGHWEAKRDDSMD